MKITKKDIQSTKTYKDLSKSLKAVVLTNNNIKCAIQKAVDKILEDGYKNWYLNTSTKRFNIMIIDELIDNHLKSK